MNVRLPALRAGYWLGWCSILAVLGGLALGLDVDHAPELLALVLAAAVLNAGVMVLPWRRWLDGGRGQAIIDLWSGGLITFVLLITAIGGGQSDFDLMLFLVAPFLATVHRGSRRVAWLALAGAAFLATAGLTDPGLSAADAFLRLALLVAATLLAVMLAEMTSRQEAARAEATARANLERALLAEAHHRVKNSLQTVADMLLLGRPEGHAGRRFDETSERIRAIAAVHRLLAEEHGRGVEAKAVLAAIMAATGVDAKVDSDHLQLDSVQAQQLGIAANELITNAAQHGGLPITVTLRAGEPAVLTVLDGGGSPPSTHRSWACGSSTRWCATASRARSR